MSVYKIEDFEDLYSKTGDIKDINTMLINRADLRELIKKAGAFEAPVSNSTELWSKTTISLNLNND